VSLVSIDKDYDALSLEMVAAFAAPIERVWQLWADPRQLERWWGPPGYPATFEDHDLSAGGAVSYFMTNPEGERAHGWWRVKAIDPPRSLAFTDGFAKADGTPDETYPNTEVRVRLTEQDGGTRMVLRFRFGSAEHMRRIERWGAFDLFPQSVAQMDAVLADNPTQEGQ